MSKVAGISAGIALLALGVSGFAYYTQTEQLATQKVALEEAVRQWEQAGPSIQITSGEISSWTGKDDKWVASKPGTNVEYSMLSDPYQAYAIVSFVNSGRMKGSIESVGVISSRGDLVFPDGVPLCPGKDSLEDCSFPIWLEPSQTLKMYIRIDGSLEDDLKCDPKNEQATLLIGFQTPANPVQSFDTRTAVAWQDFCEEVPPPPVKPTE